MSRRTNFVMACALGAYVTAGSGAYAAPSSDQGLPMTDAATRVTELKEEIANVDVRSLQFSPDAKTIAIESLGGKIQHEGLPADSKSFCLPSKLWSNAQGSD